MANTIEGLRLVYGRPWNMAASAILFPIVAVFYAWAGQVLLFDTRGPSVLVEPDVIVVAAILAALLSVSLPLQVFAVRRALAGARQTGSTALGLIIGTISMSCCAPVLLPAILSLVGLTGTTILSVNLGVHRYFVPLAVTGTVLLAYSIVSTSSSIVGDCSVPPRRAAQFP